MKRTFPPASIIVVMLVALASACTESEPPTATGPTAGITTVTTIASTSPDVSAAPTTIAGDGSIVSAFAGQQWFAGTVPSAGVAADPALEPVVVGLINQENSPVGSFPELRVAVEAAVNWANSELNGVGGRPIKLVSCITSFSVEQSQACAQQLVEAGAVVVLTGLDITANGSLPILEQNGIPVISGLPTTLAELRSDNVVSFSGSITGAYVAFVADAARNDAASIAIAYGEFESFAVPALEYGAKVAEQLGMKVTLIPFGLGLTDYLPIVQAAIDSGADAITIAAADTACIPIITSLHDLGYEGQVYMVGACAAKEILDQIPDDIQAKVVFNSEGPPNESIEGEMFALVAERYATDPAGGAGTVTFRAMMNLWAVLNKVGADAAPEAISATLKGARAEPSFWGHPYTCDAKQVPGLPALCSPQQTLFTLPTDGGDPVIVSDDWIDVPAFVANL